MSDKMIICYKGRHCVNKYEEFCLLRGFRPLNERPKKCKEYYEKRKYQ